MRRALAIGMAAVLVLGLAACDPDRSTVPRPGEPVVLTGARLPALRGQAPGRIVAFRHSYAGDAARWTQVPVQVDERKVVPFGTQPGTNDAPGTTGTVYGNGAGGPTALQYADPATFVGADGDPTFDADDELVFMASDAGGLPRGGDESEPAGVVPGSGVRVEVLDPQAPGRLGWVFLFRSDGSLDPSAGVDYVDYDFVLDSGDYTTTYGRHEGPNPERSRVRTPTYEITFGDRWIEDGWRVRSGSASGVDVLDGVKDQFAVDTCGRSNATFAEAEGAFVANVDGPVRAIRSYVGANSGPRTQRTHLMYRDREVSITDLRVHQIPQIMDFVDLSAAARGMTYASSTAPGGVTVDGRRDGVGTRPAEWETWNGPQGAVYSRSTFTTSASGLRLTWFQRDEARPPETQCWGDGSFYGAAGPVLTGGIPNTDPGIGPAATVRSTRTVHFLAPHQDPDRLAATAWALTRDLQEPVRTSTTPYRP
ncbi:hypothetical protein PO878_20505 [Iamia majanohamensis]|uniref:Lipoprotein n=1 Tax=Iamia majanohamensis TaxID=467976 RepID=A0AAF0BTJ5_9ACTN|nr:hypothetical protein [Iamia majanohamensis]WCO66877.1 hypothetical protein PO878_20505 [Iamia majanohamensis]